MTSVINPLPFTSIWGLIANFVPYLAGVIGIVLLGYLLYGGYLWMSSADKPEKLESARKTIMNAVVGFALFGVMFGLFMFISYILEINWTDLFTP